MKLLNKLKNRSEYEDVVYYFSAIMHTIVLSVVIALCCSWIFIYVYDWLAIQSGWTALIPKTWSCASAVTILLLILG